MSGKDIAEAFDQHLRSLSDQEWNALTQRVRDRSGPEKAAQLIDLSRQAGADGHIPFTENETQRSAETTAALADRLGMAQPTAEVPEGFTPDRGQGQSSAGTTLSSHGADGASKAAQLREMHRNQA